MAADWLPFVAPLIALTGIGAANLALGLKLASRHGRDMQRLDDAHDKIKSLGDKLDHERRERESGAGHAADAIAQAKRETLEELRSEAERAREEARRDREETRRLLAEAHAAAVRLATFEERARFLEAALDELRREVARAARETAALAMSSIRFHDRLAFRVENLERGWTDRFKSTPRMYAVRSEPELLEGPPPKERRFELEEVLRALERPTSDRPPITPPPPPAAPPPSSGAGARAVHPPPLPPRRR